MDGVLCCSRHPFGLHHGMNVGQPSSVIYSGRAWTPDVLLLRSRNLKCTSDHLARHFSDSTVLLQIDLVVRFRGCGASQDCRLAERSLSRLANSTTLVVVRTRPTLLDKATLTIVLPECYQIWRLSIPMVIGPHNFPDSGGSFCCMIARNV